MKQTILLHVLRGEAVIWHVFGSQDVTARLRTGNENVISSFVYMHKCLCQKEARRIFENQVVNMRKVPLVPWYRPVVPNLFYALAYLSFSAELRGPPPHNKRKNKLSVFI